MSTETEAFLADVMPRWAAADLALHNGDATPRFSLWSHEDPVTLFGAALSANGWNDISAVFRHLEDEFSSLTPSPTSTRARRSGPSRARTRSGRPRSTAARTGCGRSSTGTGTPRRVVTSRRPSAGETSGQEARH